MKSSVKDYLLGTLVIGPILSVSLAGVAVSTPLTRALLGNYHLLADVAAFLLLYGLASALMLRLMLRTWPIEPDSYDADSPVFERWKLFTVTYRLGQGALRPLTPFFMLPVLEVLFGARLGRDVACGGKIDDPYMVAVGDDTVLGNGSLISGNYVSGGKLVCGRVTIGRGVTIGANVIVLPRVTIGDGAIVMSGACVMPDSVIAAGESWRGNPARKWS
ncbi:MAG: hypothetical protein HY021_12315 [Burkholderiales bacterium]|nr:hypothetical protein [Burkholderiales bacterium]